MLLAIIARDRLGQDISFASTGHARISHFQSECRAENFDGRRKSAKRGDGFSNTGDWKVPVTLDRDDAESEAECRPDQRRRTGRQLQHVCDHHNRRTC